MTPDYPTIQNNIIKWASSQESIRCLILIGSRARDEFDTWSDLDLIFYVTDKEAYRDVSWLTTFGKILLANFMQHTRAIEHLVIYETGEKVDFHFNDMEDLHIQINSQQLHHALQRGYQILLDKDALTDTLPKTVLSPPRQVPTTDDFNQSIKAGWYHAYRQAIALRRGDLWRVKIYDTILKNHLLTLFKWYSDADTVWYEGRDMQQWLDADTWTQLQATFAHFDAKDSWRALWATLDVFQQATHAVAQKYAFEADETQSNRMRLLIKQIQQS